MPTAFDPGYGEEPFRSLVTSYPGAIAYPAGGFRLEWGPIFHRGRLDGTARVLVIGQDPAQHETIVRRILVGEAGRRIQGFLRKLGIATSYVMVKTYLYSVYGSVKAATKKSAALVGYRNQWLDALLASGNVEAVLTLGGAAQEPWLMWKATPAGAASGIAFAAMTHPTQPESSSKGDRTKLAAATKTMLSNWNAALVAVAPSIMHPDVADPHVPYGDAWADGDRVAIPEMDFPAGLPSWMHEGDGWATRTGVDESKKRRNITINVPKGFIP